ncbi:MAG: GNAT family N-acetyltransferase [Actinobacteria bacterium]|nr:GNAT family N-acetyltransferase [Actinomycetota bacterium]
MSVFRPEWVAAGDPRMAEVHELRHEALFAPFGIARDDRWDDEGEDRRHVIVSRDCRVAGYACMLVATDGTAHIRQVSVWPHLQRSGIGRALMEEIDAEATRIGLQLLWLNARVSAEPFYRRLGYATVSGVFPSGRTGVPHVRMEKRP